MFTLAGGLVVAAYAFVHYQIEGWDLIFASTWALSVMLVGAYWVGADRTRVSWKIHIRDWQYALMLVVVFSPFYLVRLGTIPHQVSSDETTMIWYISETFRVRGWRDPIELSSYAGYPGLPFLLFGAAAKWLGGATLSTMRLLHAMAGLMIIPAAYAFFRTMQSRSAALTAAIILGANHSLISVSRMAIKHNLPLLVEVLSLSLLLWGLKRRSTWILFLGGLALGGSFYLYFPARVVFPVWMLLLLLLTLTRRLPVRTAVTYASASVLGMLLIAIPVIIASSHGGDEAVFYSRHQLLIFPEARELQKNWEFETSVAKAYFDNVGRGLITFNSPLHDRSYIYTNYGHGFVDPITGFLMWLGMAAIAFGAARGRRLNVAEILSVSAFLSLWLFLAFVTTKAPSYLRLLVTLPFVAYLAARGLRAAATLASRLIKRRSWSPVFPRVVLLLVVMLNVAAYRDFVMAGFTRGNDIGGTARLVEARKSRAPYSYVLIADEERPYYGWGSPEHWKFWVKLFADKDQTVSVVSPDSFDARSIQQPCTLLLNAKALPLVRPKLLEAHAYFLTHNVMPDGKLLAIDVIPYSVSGMTGPNPEP